ncbi:hypothetical protein NCAS_0I00150 [Naumovozyma castellii]|uniref:Uncharacterized protein n=1 Tax=Naumovozyma castellii TaxID=27288 RepID=G0VJK3_NAUCA|nr:hypothetical protein NCAS_0I00150 [Naumovozyma castellii CBS 4309]CCC71683.1 hypothetical protein NCAS_0I00150 [Naumovozyma castellii CBS 4309]
MSFDWLNIPGLNTEDNTNINNNNNTGASTNNGPGGLNGSLGPPSVSFDFGFPMNGNNTGLPTMDQSVRSQSDTSIVNMSSTDAVSDYSETSDDLRVPLSLSQTQLTNEELRTYLRWYNYIIAKTHGKLVRLMDVFKFLCNFNITDQLKNRIMAIFRSCKNALNIGQFFAVLRLVSKALLQNVLPTRKMILDKAPIPKPKPIITISTDNDQEVYEEVDEDTPNTANGNNNENGKVDFDSFTSLLLTGRTARKRIRRKIKNAVFKNKRVRFAEHITFQEPPKPNSGNENNNNNAMILNQTTNNNNMDDSSSAVPQGPLDLSLPMDQLLKQMALRKKNNSALVSTLPNEQQETEEEKEVLEDMKDSLSHFKNITTVDSATLLPDSTSTMQPMYMNNENNALNQNNPSMNQVPLQPLKPTATGSANHLFRQEFAQNTNPISDSNQMPLQPLKPTATGSANYLFRSYFEQPTQNQTTQQAQPPQTNNNSNMNTLQLHPTATGSANYLMKQQGPTPSQGIRNETSPIQTPNIFVSPQTTGQFMNMNPSQHNTYLQQPQSHMNTLQQQNTYPGRFPPTQVHNQPQPSNNNLLAPTNAGNSYLQALLSHSPSPSTSQLNLPTINQQNNSNANQSSHLRYNTTYQQPNGTTLQYQQPQQQMVSYGQNPNQMLPPLPQQQHQSQHQNVRFAAAPSSYNGAPMQGYPNNTTLQGNRPHSQSQGSEEILSNYRSLQNQVNSLQNTYGRI